ncbi:MAG TPA: hypothetical protein PK251_03275 [Candidatus Latescibacteria bacterium]|nr:hypothetical protein [Candidatus Latescibacterota bacterium]HOF60538.1 hypothetical protein [Candidatus Latescibacterota bacterium]HOS63760.1 hypothetical protein [Candidatus Latescibacterota bacterium]HOT37110.1 hypothetical protein [Candidatus Latescibacterota bacterium]HPC46333.1 hypothetical protein [Candidatus Latescibacterota bacterium]
MGPASASEASGHTTQPEWFPAVVELLRVRGYLTLSVKIGYELVLIVSGSAGEAAVIDLSQEPTSLWTDAWAGMRQVLPRVPVIAILPAGNTDETIMPEHGAVARVVSPVDAESLVGIVEHVLQNPSYSR